MPAKSFVRHWPISERREVHDRAGMRRGRANRKPIKPVRSSAAALPALFPVDGCAVLAPAVAFAQQPVELVDERVEGVVRRGALGGCNQVRAADLDLARGRVVVLLRLAHLLILMKANIDSDDVRVVAQQDGKAFPNRGLHRGRQVDVHALHDEFLINGFVRNHRSADRSVARELRLVETVVNECPDFPRQTFRASPDGAACADPVTVFFR